MTHTGYNTVFIIHDASNEFNNGIECFLLDVYKPAPCSRLIKHLRKTSDTRVTRTMLGLLCMDHTYRVTEEDYTLINSVCLTDLRQHEIGMLHRVSFTRLHKLGQINLQSIILTQ